MSEKKPWAGRFQKETDELVEKFTASIHFDRRLYPYDIRGSIAHARMLAKQGIITEEEGMAIVEGLGEVLREIDRNEFRFSDKLEDIHMNVESRLVEKIGPVGEKLHTARSRNDQIALDLRLFLKDGMGQVLGLVEDLLDALVHLAAEHIDVVMPGYTHMQRAQPVLFAHHLMAYVQMFRRDRQRLEQALERVKIMPLGSAALAGTPFPLDREFVARELGFNGVSENSMDAVSDRDFAVEFVFTASMIMMHLSRMAEELVIWSTTEFGFIEMSDAFTTGSSIMPQKKNPDVAELVRGKTGRVYGDLTALLTLLKGIPLTYNRDLQEDKEPVFDALDTVSACLAVTAGAVRDLKVNRDRMENAMHGGFMTATDAADYLVRKGLPFRRAHHVIGEMVAYCIARNKDLANLTMKELNEFSKLFDSDVYQAIDVRTSIEARSLIGGTAPETVRAAVEKALGGK